MIPFAEDAAGIGALAEPIRRELYLFVCSQPGAVSRDQAADATGVARHQAKFHLDKLETEGLLVAEYARLGGRKGPGAGRTSKLYRRAERDIAVSLPDRDYELAGRLMADAIAASTDSGEPTITVLHRLAHQHGRAIATTAIERAGSPSTPDSALAAAVEALSEHGYEPRPAGERTVMANCPFHALAQEQTELVCQMNHALIGGLVESFEPHSPEARLDPGENRCCVTLTRAAGRPDSTLPAR
jgi:predicted ArsR family transcriptional regulator